MKLSKRNKLDIYFDILQLLNTQSKNEKLSLTKVSHRANLPYDRFRIYLDELIHFGLVSYANEDFAVTEKGLEFIKEYGRISNFLRRIGILW